MSEFDVVDRPTGSVGRGANTALYQAVLGTAQTGKAVRVPLNGRSPASVRNSMYVLGKRAGMRVHASADGDGLLVWMEPKASVESEA